MWQGHKQTVENCSKLCDDKAKLELIEMLSESMEPEREALYEPERKPEAASSSDDETIIPDNTQARIPLPNLNQKEAVERKVKSELIETLEREHEASSSSDDETIIPDNTQARIPGLQRSTRSRRKA